MHVLRFKFGVKQRNRASYPKNTRGNFDARLLAPASVMWGITGCGVAFGLQACLVCATAVVVVVLFLSPALAHEGTRYALWVLIPCILLALAGIVPRLLTVDRDRLTQAACAIEQGGDSRWRLSGTVSAGPRPVIRKAYLRNQHTVDSESIDSRGGEGIQADLPTMVVLHVQQDSGTDVVVFAYQAEWTELRPGDRLTASVTVLEPGKDYLTVAVVRATGGVKPYRPQGLLRWSATVRSRFRDIAQYSLPQELGALLPSMVVGDTSLVTSTQSDAFRMTGLSHLSAVSGANLTCILGAVLVLMQLAGARQWIRVVLSVGALAGFVCVVGPEPSVLRAAVSGAIGAMAVFGSRHKQAMPALATGIMSLLIYRPQFAIDAGFALSVIATMGIITVAPLLARRWEHAGIPRSLAQLLAVTVTAQIITIPITAAVFETVSVVGLLANILVSPVVPVITSVGIVAALFAPWCAALTHALAAFLWPCLWWVDRIALWCSHLPIAQAHTPGGLVGAVLYGLIAGLIFWILLRGRGGAGHEGAGHEGAGHEGARNEGAGHGSTVVHGSALLHGFTVRGRGLLLSRGVAWVIAWKLVICWVILVLSIVAPVLVWILR